MTAQHYHCYKSIVLTKNERLLCDARPACHKLRLPSPSAMPNLLPCCENRQRVTLANVPGGRGVHTTCWWPHSHIWTAPSCPPVKYSGINGCAHMRLILSTLCLSTCQIIRERRGNKIMDSRLVSGPIWLKAPRETQEIVGKNTKK